MRGRVFGGVVGRVAALGAAAVLGGWVPAARAQPRTPATVSAVQETAARPAAGSAQETGTVLGQVVDEVSGAPVAEARVTLRPPGADVAGERLLRATTRADGRYRFAGLSRGTYRLRVERFGYRPVSLELTLDRTEPLVVTIRIRPVPFPLGPLDSWVTGARGPSLVTPGPGASRDDDPGARSEAVRVRQRRFLSSDARQFGRADLEEANTLAGDDLLRGLQRLPGVAIRDDYGADLWTRGAAAGRTAVLFDGVPLLGGLHALGALSGLDADALGTATFQPGVVSASLQGAGAAVLDVTSRSRADGGTATTASLSPLSARLSLTGEVADRVGWMVGARRSYLDALSRAARGLGLTSGTVPYAFGDLTGRVDAALGSDTRLEASAFWQDDRVSGDVEDLAYGNEGDWGTLAFRASLVTVSGHTAWRHTLGMNDFNASLGASPSDGDPWAPLHPATENHYRTLLWESRIDGRPSGTEAWSAGVRATRERHRYDGPGVDLATLLSPQELERRGIGDLSPVIAGLQHAQLLETEAMTRVAVWGERRQRLTERLEIEGGLRVETGDRVRGSRMRLAPRLRVRWGSPDAPLSLSAGYGRSYQYLQSIARTDVLRSGLRASEVLEQAGADAPALRSDVMTLGGEAWRGRAWLFGATLWLRRSSGILVPEPTPGVIDGARPAVPAEGRASGLELSARKLEGPVRGFANYTLSRSRHRVGSREFDASEDRRHVANIGVTADAGPSWRVGATFRAQSGAPYTRITLIDSVCDPGSPCEARAPVLVGAPGLQRAPAYLSLDLRTEWTHGFGEWSLSVWGQLMNVLGRANAITYYSSCVCTGGGDPARASLGDRFDRGLPRLPVVGLRARFR